MTTVATQAYKDQKAGTSGLRKRVTVFEQPNYVENFIAAILASIPEGAEGATLVVGGDGRYYNDKVISAIIALAPASGVKKLIIGKDGYFATPAVSQYIRSVKATGGIILTASHNPGGPKEDMGIKYNIANGGPAPESVTNKMFEVASNMTSYKKVDVGAVDVSKEGTFSVHGMEIEVIDSITPYVTYLKEHVFDFGKLKAFAQGPLGGSVLYDGLSAVTGPYARAILVGELGLPESVLLNCEPKPDFGGHHPDPNLTYAADLVERVNKGGIAFGAASDGDGDRNMIVAKDGTFVTPSDSVALIADWAPQAIPYFKDGLKGLARSMPTSGALDRVAKAKGVALYEVPTGWKFFGNLMDAGKLSICGEESFGTGSDHVREKDGIWAILAWLSIFATAHEQGLTSIAAILQDHYAKYGRTFFSRYDYEQVESDKAGRVMDKVRALFSDASFVGKAVGPFTVAKAGDFEYTDPVDGSYTKNQGLYAVFTDGSKITFRLSGTGSTGATIRLYVEKYTQNAQDYALDTAAGIKPLIDEALRLSDLVALTGRTEPTVIT